jgi:hypothetical protein
MCVTVYKYVTIITGVLSGKWAQERWYGLFKIRFWKPSAGRGVKEKLTENGIAYKERDIILQRNFHLSFIVSRPHIGPQRSALRVLCQKLIVAYLVSKFTAFNGA